MHHVEITDSEDYAAHFQEHGYFVFKISPADLNTLNELVNAHYTQLVGANTGPAECRAAVRVEDHHLYGDRFDHGLIADSRTRILPPAGVAAVRALGFIEVLQTIVGAFQFGRVQARYPEELTWRAVRPGQPSDVGPWHTDKWFWDIGIGAGTEPDGWVERLKLWIPLRCEHGTSGLAIVPGSHKRDMPYDTEERHGRIKPIYTGKDSEQQQFLFSGDDGRAMVFHDALLHRGIPSSGQQCRVSFDATLFTLQEGWE